jgi:hypothetical protein
VVCQGCSNNKIYLKLTKTFERVCLRCLENGPPVSAIPQGDINVEDTDAYCSSDDEVNSPGADNDVMSDDEVGVSAGEAVVSDELAEESIETEAVSEK